MPARILILLILLQLDLAKAANPAREFHARYRQPLRGETNRFELVEKSVRWDPRKTAIIICDMWDQHWCKGATARVAEMAPRMNAVIQEARGQGMLIIHAPSATMNFYADWPQRKRAQQAPKATPPSDVSKWKSLNLAKEGPLPIDDSDGGCNEFPQCPGGSPWKRQIATLEIAPEDYISDSGEEVYNVLAQHGVENVIILGVHTNMCVLGRPFSIRQMVSVGKNVLLMRDMTDTMYNSRKRPFVSHFAGTDMVIEHIEKHWCGSITSAEFLGGEAFRFKDDKRPHVVFVVGENEYRTWETLPEFAKQELAWRGMTFEFVNAPPAAGNEFTNWPAIAKADLLFLSVRRRTPPAQMMNAIRAHLEAGKPLVGIRTASHAFGAKPPDDQHRAWDTFDRDILGGHYENHYGNNLAPALRAAPGGAAHPVLTGVAVGQMRTQYSLYRSRDLAATAMTLLSGTITVDGKEVTEPVAWVNTNANRRVFYTSLGGADDFKMPGFRRLLVNGVLWALNQPIPPSDGEAAKPEASTQRIEVKTERVTLQEPAPSPLPGGELVARSRRGNEAGGTASAGIRLLTPAATGEKAAEPGKKRMPQEKPLSPAESFGRFNIADDLEIEQVLAEPVVRQPVFLSFDERGRLWVVQYLQYPHPAGVKLMSRDNVWRAVYDKAPPPPPNHVRGEDKITIHEDANGDGIFETHKVFVEGLNIVTSLARGRGGVWVLNPPYLLFYPDRNSDDAPDGPPELRLSGFGLEDTHSVANSLRWGPDGWLYGCQGSTVTGNILVYGADGKPLNSKPIYSQGQNIWRYHSEGRRYEVFAEGGGNAFGLEIDAKGRAFSGHNGGNTRGFHYVQGGYLQKGFEKHGPLSNPYAFGYFPPMPHPNVERFTHNFLVYDGGALPGKYAGKLFGVEPLQARVVLSDIQPDRSSFRTVDLNHPVTTSDEWFRPVDIKAGPDGAIYVADWYDRQVNHYRNHEGEIDKDHGRIYRLKAKGAKPAAALNLGAASTRELVELLRHKNKWFRQESLRLLADRRDKSAIEPLAKLVHEKTGQEALEALWALHVCGGFTEPQSLQLLHHADPFVRVWTTRLIGDSGETTTLVAAELARLAEHEPNVEVRSQLASTAKRLPAKDALPIVKNLLAHDEDLNDPRLPLLIWWAIEAKAETDREAVLGLLGDASFWLRPLAQNHLLERLMRRYAAGGSRQDLLACARLLQLAPSLEHAAKLMAGFELAFKGRPLANLPEELTHAMAKAGADTLSLRLRRGQPDAAEKALALVLDARAGKSQRLELIQVLGEVRPPRSDAVLLKLLQESRDGAVCKAVLGALRAFDQAGIGAKVAAQFSALPEEARASALELLASRREWTLALLDSVESGRLAKSVVPKDWVRRIQSYADPEIGRILRRHWEDNFGSSTAEMRKKIEHLTSVLYGGSGYPHEGQKLFNGLCAACHKLFSQGGQIGPDLTMFKRDDIENMALSIVNPSAEIREGYGTFNVTTKDGRALSGFLAEKDERITVLRGVDGENSVIRQTEIAEMKPAGTSLMPEGLLDGLNDQQVRDLFAYLRSTQPLVR